MPIDNNTGYYDYETQTIYSASTGNWNGLSSTTWANWTRWAYTTNDQIIWRCQPIIRPNPTSQNLTIICVADAVVSYKIYTSETGAFAGEESLIEVPTGATNVPSIKATYTLVVAYADKILNPPTITFLQAQFVDPVTRTLTLNSLNTSTLGGSQTARVLPVPAGLGTILDIKITPQEVTAYALDVYVTNTPTSTYLIPKIISKASAAPTIALVGVDNQPRDGLVDVVVTALNPTYMSGNNLISE